MTTDKNTYIVTWSFNNPTVMKAAALGVTEEEACREIIQRFHEAPEFKIEDIHEATEEELNDLDILPEDVREAKDQANPERMN